MAMQRDGSEHVDAATTKDLGVTRPPYVCHVRDMAGSGADGVGVLRRLATDQSAVEAWAEDYIRFDRLPT